MEGMTSYIPSLTNLALYTRCFISQQGCQEMLYIKKFKETELEDYF